MNPIKNKIFLKSNINSEKHIAVMQGEISVSSITSIVWKLITHAHCARLGKLG